MRMGVNRRPAPTVSARRETPSPKSVRPFSHRRAPTRALPCEAAVPQPRPTRVHLCYCFRKKTYQVQSAAMNTIDTVALGTTRLRLPRIGLGSAPLGGLYSSVDETEAVRTVHRAVELGANYVDTAPLYGYGRSERRVGKALSTLPRSDYLLSTKVGRLLQPVDEPPDPNEIVEASLRFQP